MSHPKQIFEAFWVFTTYLLHVISNNINIWLKSVFSPKDSGGKYKAGYSLITCRVYTGRAPRGMSPFLKLEKAYKEDKSVKNYRRRSDPITICIGRRFNRA